MLIDDEEFLDDGGEMSYDYDDYDENDDDNSRVRKTSSACQHCCPEFFLQIFGKFVR